MAVTPFPTYATKDLAKWSGRPEASYTDYADTAISQAQLLFRIATCLAAIPDDQPYNVDLFYNAVLAMADHIFLGQQFQQVEASPFNSESIGSYSYSKTYARAAAAVATQSGTGVMWFDMAVAKMGTCDYSDGIPTYGGIEVFEHDGAFRSGWNLANSRFLSPIDMQRSHYWGWDPGWSPEVVGEGRELL
jgi:hypothetical protein